MLVLNTNHINILCTTQPPTLASMMQLFACTHTRAPTLVLLTLPVQDLIKYSDGIYSQCFVVTTYLAHSGFQNGREFSTLPLCHGWTAFKSQFEPTESLQTRLGKTALLEGDAFETQIFCQYSFHLSAHFFQLLILPYSFHPNMKILAKNCCFTKISLIMRITTRGDSDSSWCYDNLCVQKANIQIPTFLFAFSQ